MSSWWHHNLLQAVQQEIDDSFTLDRESCEGCQKDLRLGLSVTQPSETVSPRSVGTSQPSKISLTSLIDRP